MEIRIFFYCKLELILPMVQKVEKIIKDPKSQIELVEVESTLICLKFTAKEKDIRNSLKKLRHHGMLDDGEKIVIWEQIKSANDLNNISKNDLMYLGTLDHYTIFQEKK